MTKAKEFKAKTVAEFPDDSPPWTVAPKGFRAVGRTVEASIGNAFFEQARQCIEIERAGRLDVAASMRERLVGEIDALAGRGFHALQADRVRNDNITAAARDAKATVLQHIKSHWLELAGLSNKDMAGKICEAKLVSEKQRTIQGWIGDFKRGGNLPPS